MRKGSVCAIAATLLIATGGVETAQAAQRTKVAEKKIVLNCETVEVWKEKLESLGGQYRCLAEFLSGFSCQDRPEGNLPVIPEVPETKPEVKPEAPETKPETKPEVKPEVPETKPETKPEVKPEGQGQAYEYGLRITELVNEHRKAAGLAPVQYSVQLSKPAQTRAYEIEKSFSHTRPDGRYFSSALKDAGISYGFTGENIAWGQKSPEEVVTAWMNSPGHRANILHKSFKELGIGYYRSAKGVNYFTQLFTD